MPNRGLAMGVQGVWDEEAGVLDAAAVEEDEDGRVEATDQVLPPPPPPLLLLFPEATW